jgi:hypothetical protein
MQAVAKLDKEKQETALVKFELAKLHWKCNGCFEWDIQKARSIYNVTVVICGITEPAQIEICLMNHLPTLTGFARTAMLPPRIDLCAPIDLKCVLANYLYVCGAKIITMLESCYFITGCVKVTT